MLQIHLSIGVEVTPADAEKTEVDFLLKKGKNYCAIEVKATSKIRPDDLKGLRAIKNLEGLKRRILIYTGKDSQKIDQGIEVINLWSLSKVLAEGKLWVG